VTDIKQQSGFSRSKRVKLALDIPVLNGVARVPCAHGQKYFCAPTNKNCKVWSEK